MKGTRRNPDWLVRHDGEIRELAWLGAAAIAGTPLAPNERDASPAAAVESHEAPSAEREALLAAEARLVEIAGALEGERVTNAAARANIEQLEGELAASREAAVAVATQLRDDAEGELVKLAIAVAERVVGRELSVAPALIVDWVREALAGSDLGGSFVVATSADLSAAVPEAAWGELEDALRMDPALPAGTCEVRDGGRTVTVSAEERFETVAEALANVGGAKAA